MVKAHNRRLVFDDIVANAPTTRAQIAANTSLSAGTVATIVEELCRRGVAREVKEQRQDGAAPVGRRPNRVEFLPKSRRIICIDLATRHPAYYVKDLDLKSEQVRHRIEDGSTDRPYEEMLHALFGDIAARVEESGGHGSPIIGVGVSVPGPYRLTEDRIFCKLVPELNSIRLRALLKEYFDYPIHIDHDVKLALGAEIRSIPYHEHKTILSVFLGEGVGSAISINGSVFGGAHEFAGEIGQMRVRDGGTLEDEVAWSSFLSALELPTGFFGASDDEILTYLSTQYEQNESHLLSVLERTTQTIAHAIANIICVLNPHAIVVSGHYSVFGDRFLHDLQAATEELVIDDLKRDLQFIRSTSKENDAIMGAASAVRELWLQNSKLPQKEGKQ